MRAMRVAIAGSHRVGKSTLLEAIASALPAYETVDEPYHLMEAEGHEFSHPPSLEDFEAQLARSLEELGSDAENVLFDRCPLDLVAYASVHEDGDSFDLEEWLPRVRDAMQTLDLVVFVPIEQPDRVKVTRDEDAGGLRESVDEKLRELLVEDALELGVEVLEVSGALARRVHAVLPRLSGARRPK